MPKPSQSKNDSFIVRAQDGTFYRVPRERLQKHQLDSDVLILASRDGSRFAIPRAQLQDFKVTPPEAFRYLRESGFRFRRPIRFRVGRPAGPPWRSRLMPRFGRIWPQGRVR